MLITEYAEVLDGKTSLKESFRMAQTNPLPEERQLHLERYARTRRYLKRTEVRLGETLTLYHLYGEN